MKRIVVGIVTCGLVVVLAGCATTVRPSVVLTADGPAAGLQIGQQSGNFLVDHWGKILSGVAAGGGLVYMARENHWFGWGKDKDSQPEPAAITVTGNGNTVNYNQNNNGTQTQTQGNDQSTTGE